MLFVDEGLDSKLQHYKTFKISWKESKTLHLDHNGHIEGDTMQNHEQQKKWKKGEKLRLYGQKKKFLPPCPSALVQI